MLHPSATLGWEILETLHPATAAIRRTLFDAHNPAADLEQIQQLTIQHSHHGSLENVVTMGQPLVLGDRSTARRISFSTLMRLRLRGPSAFVKLGNLLLVSRRRRFTKMSVVQFVCRSCR
jgi:hypothetical protein